MDFKQEGKSCEFTLTFFVVDYQEKNDNGCWLLLVSTVVSIKTCSVVMSSYRYDVKL